ncbi:hypothetical protein ACFV3R_26385 [Streptomyces sp. NPDC059740]|uniref:hypothetical protein n=1 Tax=Streptomyces sp. NPDC059740 TaxID=3346926 RepID=UPI0036694543
MADGFDFQPGAEVPLSGAAGQTAATQALASVAYRDSALAAISDADSDIATSGFTPPRLSMFEPNLGEAFARAVQVRMLGGGRAAMIQSFGMEPRTVVEHCLAASRIRRLRDTRLTALVAVFGLVFLPGALLWLAGFQLRRALRRFNGSGTAALGGVILFLVAGLGVLFLLRPPFSGLPGLYVRLVVWVPAVGWWWAKRICEATARDLRDSWSGLLAGGGVGPKIPEAVPRDPNHTAAEELRQSLARLDAEQKSNVVFYAGPRGILGMGTRWGSWQMAEELRPAKSGGEIHPFRSYDVIRAVHDRLKQLERSPLHTGGFRRPPSVRHWIVSPVGEKATKVGRPEGAHMDGYQVRGHEIERICNEQQFGAGDRHYLGVQFVEWDGQLVLTMLITVTVLHETLRVEVTGHALGPVHPLFTSGPPDRTKTVPKTVRFWETKTHNLPLVEPSEVVRQTVRAPLTWFPPVLDFLGGKLVLPEPFGLRHAWADKPWRHRFMADDAMRVATPVLRVVHNATLHVLRENGVDTERFEGRSLFLSGQVQDPQPKLADEYSA